MATLQYSDLAKRDNFNVLAKRINGEGGFQLDDQKSPVYKATGKVIITKKNKPAMFDGNVSAGTLQMFVDSKTGSDSIDIELKNGNRNNFYRLTKIYKDKEFGGVAAKAGGQGSERQESGLVQALNEAAASKNKAFVSSLGRNSYIKSAGKKEGLSSIGKEPYIDIIVETSSKKYHVSCKGDTAPSLAGGGVASIKLVAPDLIKLMYKTLERHLKTTLKLKEGDVIPADSLPDFYIKIPDEYVKKILVGTPQMGGPVDTMYIGGMNVTSSMSGNELKLNGSFYSIAQYMKKIGDFYFRIRKRDLDSSNTIKIVYNKKTNEGYPLLMASPKNNKNNVRVVIQDNVPTTGKVLQLVKS